MTGDGKVCGHARHDPPGIGKVSRRLAQRERAKDERGFFVGVRRLAVGGKRRGNAGALLPEQLRKRVGQRLERARKG